MKLSFLSVGGLTHSVQSIPQNVKHEPFRGPGNVPQNTCSEIESGASLGTNFCANNRLSEVCCL